MSPADIDGILAFLRAAEKLKTTHRSGYTSAGNPESVAEHSWRLCLMAMMVGSDMPSVDMGHLLKLCIVHDLGEAVSGDIPAPEQARRAAAGAPGKAEDERRGLVTLASALPAHHREEVVALWDEYEAATTPAAQLAKALDKLETILQHTQGANPPDFDHEFNLQYGRRHTEQPPVAAAIRAILDRETARLAGLSKQSSFTSQDRISHE